MNAETVLSFMTLDLSSFRPECLQVVVRTEFRDPRFNHFWDI